ncbi:PGAP1 family protein [Gordonia polyisoprenivorans VH2]|uniref:PGAP1 family protein n=1 Tax=Gordonia polyisoprenivorans (strain DSM 44266 / VH2) TaxID=1112204 RepID=H6N2N3_GORPV|nr:alpha/beta hydrolase [Gordonia polyisoprenivorans]AFA73458.1 PGAP1 family protein [Gordonia polyisoprenivorans VH2]
MFDCCRLSNRRCGYPAVTETIRVNERTLRTMSSRRLVGEQGEVRALARLGLSELGKATVGIARVHRATSAAVFGTLDLAIGRPVAPVRTVHDAVSEAVYTSITGVLDLATIVADALPETGPQPTRTVRGAAMIGILDGLIGDALDDEHSPLAPQMAPRVGGSPVAVTTDGLAAAYPRATGHLVVFLHGLMETEHAWRLGGRPTYGARLVDDIGATEVQIRYNTGRHISDNGATLARLLSEMVLLWPVPVTRISLVGHSMGGLVIRSACHLGTSNRAPWVPLVTETVSLGSPHLGAPLARGVHAASSALRMLSVTRPFGELLRRRSAGVRDLFHGNVIAEDGPSADPDGWWQAPGADVPLLAGARHLFVTASLFGNPRHPLGRFIGDGLVLTPSGRGFHRSRRIGFRDEDGMHLGRANHFTLLNHDEIYLWLRDGLRPLRALTAG